MYSINIHIHCDEHEQVQSIYESVSSEGDLVSFSVNEVPSEPISDTGPFLMCHWCSFTSTSMDDITAHERERHEQGVTELIDHFSSESDAEPVQRQDAAEIGIISTTIFQAGRSLIGDFDWTRDDFYELLNKIVTVTWGGADTDLPSGPDEEQPWILICIWAVQDWKARGVTVHTARAMCNGIVADVNGAR